MAEKARYPQIPGTVWWGVRSIMKRTPNATIDERMLGVSLGVQEAAARAYITELRSVGILSEENKPTPLAQKWRLDDTYAEAVETLIQTVYPQGLIDVAPPGDAERSKVVSWFQREGLGQGAAGNKAATYLMISSASPNEAPSTGGKTTQGEGPARTRSPVAKQTRTAPAAPRPAKAQSPNSDGGAGGARAAPADQRGGEMFPLNVNVQIHISADAGTEQIESIFQAMRRYLYDTPNS